MQFQFGIEHEVAFLNAAGQFRHYPIAVKTISICGLGIREFGKSVGILRDLSAFLRRGD
jgi:hypothetical protein